ncbi:MAG: YHS domain-containing (seleno)protein [Terricaulis sp.]
MRVFLRAALLALGLTVSFAAPALADQPPVYQSLFNRTGAGGYDVVSFFTDHQPVRGVAQYKTTHQGVEYRFASAEHLAAFRAEPARYLPQYGGYCAWAVSQGYTAPGDPRYWRIVDGKLYLNYDASVQRRWEADIPGFIRSANSNWPSVLAR